MTATRMAAGDFVIVRRKTHVLRPHQRPERESRCRTRVAIDALGSSFRTDAQGSLPPVKHSLYGGAYRWSHATRGACLALRPTVLCHDRFSLSNTRNSSISC